MKYIASLVALVLLAAPLHSEDCDSRLKVDKNILAPESWMNSKGEPISLLDANQSLMMRTLLSTGAFDQKFMAEALGVKLPLTLAIFPVRHPDGESVTYDLGVSRGSLQALKAAAMSGNREGYDWLLSQLRIHDGDAWMSLENALTPALKDFLKAFPVTTEDADVLVHFSNRKKAYLVRSDSGMDFVFRFFDIDYLGKWNSAGIISLNVVTSYRGKVRVLVKVDRPISPEFKMDLKKLVAAAEKKAQKGLPYSQFIGAVPYITDPYRERGMDVIEVYFSSRDASLFSTIYPLRFAIHLLSAFERP